VPLSDLSGHVAFRNPSVARAALNVPRGGKIPDLTSLCKERVQVLLDLEKVKDDALKPRDQVRLEGALDRTISPMCHTLDVREALKEGCTRIKMEMQLPNEDPTNVYVLSIADDPVTLELYRKIGRIVHESEGWDNVRDRENRSDVGVMTGLGHRVNLSGKIEMYANCRDSAELRRLLRRVNERLAKLVEVRAPEFRESIRRHRDDYDFKDKTFWAVRKGWS
jgi:hypothetical protein